MAHTQANQGTDSKPVDPTGIWLADEEEEDKLDRLEPKVLGRHDGARFMRKQAAAASSRRKARKLRQRADRLAATGSTRRPPRRRIMPPARELANRLRFKSDRRPLERSTARPREHGRGRSRVTRAGPSGEDDPPEPPAASPFQAAWRSALYLTVDELEALAEHARIRVAWLDRWSA